MEHMSRVLEERKTIPEQVEDILSEICDDYCKWPLIYHDANDELKLDKKCINCPLTRLR